jgi:hypothetical protein
MSPPIVYEETMPSTQRTIKMSAIVQTILSPLGATPPSHTAAYQKKHAAHDGDAADPGGNRTVRFGGDLQVPDSHDAPLRTVAKASEHDDGAKHGQYQSSNG